MHRDVKPSVVMMTKIQEHYVAKLASFKFAKECKDDTNLYGQHNDSFKGSYMDVLFLIEDPNGLKYTAYVDVFSLGLLFAVILSYSEMDKTLQPISGNSNVLEMIFTLSITEFENDCDDNQCYLYLSVYTLITL